MSITFNRRSGYTIIEMMMTVAILAIIASIATPSFSNLYERTETRIVTERLIRFLYFARNYAIKSHHPVNICASIDGYACGTSKEWSEKRLMIYVDKNKDNQFHHHDDELIRLSDPMPKNSFLIFRAFRNRSFLKWLPTGVTDSQNGHFTYCPPSRNLTLARHFILNAAGRIYDGPDSNHDGIVENRYQQNVSCD